ncbi:MFS transporter [Actinomadura logoneensis]|uniref:MFS transporter n=1 Tax=Actinomadura logoneensis TaxID=2293572 RepID=A0A372JI65_9ACTN|nr:MFS transporter [Actinomadura logoneensis]RFU39715.1 MFS transporter [Actinomadura logoneensis]
MDSAATETGAPPGRTWGLLLILSAQFTIMLDGSIVTVALPSVQRELGFSPPGVQVVMTAYSTALGGALILGGRIGDLWGRRRVLTAGMAGFAAASLGCGLARDAAVLVAGRLVQGFCAALIAPTALALLATSFPEGAARARAMSRFGIATVLGFVGGLVLSGPLVEAFGWRGVFFATVPVGAVMAGVTPRVVPAAERTRRRLDVAGAVLVTAGVGALVAAPALGAASGWGSPRCAGAVAVAAALLVAFAVVEVRRPEPLVRFGLFRSGTLRAANLVSFASGMMSGGAYLLVTLYLQEVEGTGPVRAGLVVAPVGLVNLALGPVLGRTVVRVGLRAAVGGSAVAAGSLLALVASRMTPGRDVLVFGAVLLPFGAAMLATTVASTLAATSGVADHEQGLAGGVRQTSFQLGVAIGVAVLVSFAAWRAAALEPGAVPGPQHPAALAGGYRDALYLLAGLVIMAGTAACAMARGAGPPTSRRAAGRDEASSSVGGNV